MALSEIDVENLGYIEKRRARYQENGRLKRERLYKLHPEEQKRRNSTSRGLGFNPLNNYFIGSTHHHLHVEGNGDFVIFIPTWLHRRYSHDVSTWRGMDTINVIAFDYLINEELYKGICK